DIYALAVIIYEMLTGSVPYSADTQLAILMARVNDPMPLPRDRNPDLSERLQEALLKGLAKTPDDRYRTAGELVRALDAASQPPAPPALTTPASEPKISERISAPTPSQKRHVVLVTALLSALAVAALAVFMWSRTQPAS